MTAESGNRAALYLRLSKDDEGQGESGSIHSQRCMLLAYAKERGFAVCGEYVDDGYSGTTFQRPGFQRLLEDIERGLVDLVLTKDLSRLGRDYIQVGHNHRIAFAFTVFCMGGMVVHIFRFQAVALSHFHHSIQHPGALVAIGMLALLGFRHGGNCHHSGQIF